MTLNALTLRQLANVMTAAPKIKESLATKAKGLYTSHIRNVLFKRIQESNKKGDFKILDKKINAPTQESIRKSLEEDGYKAKVVKKGIKDEFDPTKDTPDVLSKKVITNGNTEINVQNLVQKFKKAFQRPEMKNVIEKEKKSIISNIVEKQVVKGHYKGPDKIINAFEKNNPKPMKIIGDAIQLVRRELGGWYKNDAAFDSAKPAIKDKKAEISQAILDAAQIDLFKMGILAKPTLQRYSQKMNLKIRLFNGNAFKGYQGLFKNKEKLKTHLKNSVLKDEKVKTARKNMPTNNIQAA